MKLSSRHLLISALVFLFSSIGTLRAQDYARNEVTLSADIQSYGFATCVPIAGTIFCEPKTYHYLTRPALSVTYDYNLSPSLAIEGSIVPTTQFVKNNDLTAGREMLALGGVKTGWRGAKWGFYGDIKVGAGSFSCGTWDYFPKPYSNCGRQTNFALLYGGAIERKLARRWTLRLDAGHLLMPEFDQVLQRGANFEVSHEARLIQHYDLRLGVTRSFGVMRNAEREPEPVAAKWDAGVLFSLQPRTLPYYPIMNAYPGEGVWVSWNFSRHVSWDTAVMHAGRVGGRGFIDYQAGGRSLEALTGVKAGIRRDHMGYFAKLRGGTITFGKTERQVWFDPQGRIHSDFGMFTNPALEVGGVLEAYPSRHTILRFDAGSATVFYQPKDVYQQFVKYSIPEQTQVTMLLGFGAGYRF